MKRTIRLDEFIEEMGTETFSREGLEALYEYFIELEDDTGIEIEVDPIAINCDYTEYDDVKDFNDVYGTKYKNYKKIKETDVIPVDEDRFIIRNY